MPIEGNRLHSDDPVESSAFDELKREKNVERIAHFLSRKQGDSSMVLSIEDRFGGGKTSFMRLLEERLRNMPEEMVIFWFNPWMVSGSDDLIRTFLMQLAIRLRSTKGDGSEKLKDAGKKLESYAAALALFKVIPGAEPWISIVEKALERSGNAATKIGAAHEQDLPSIRKSVEDALKESNRSVIVFVDDLDRLPPKETATMIQVLKAVSDLRGIHFVAAYEHYQICSALERAGYQNPRVYMEKVVQLRFRLPEPLPDQLQEVFVKIMDSVNKMGGSQIRLPGESELLDYYIQEGLLDALGTVRNIKRLANALLLFDNEAFHHINRADLIAVETIRLCSEGIWDQFWKKRSLFHETSIENYHAILAEVIFKNKESPTEEKREKVLGDMEQAFPSDLFCIHLLKVLFQKLPAQLRHLDTPATGRLWSENSFQFYVSHHGDPSEVSPAEVIEILNNSETTLVRPEQMIPDRLKNFVRLVQIVATSHKPSKPLALISRLTRAIAIDETESHSFGREPLAFDHLRSLIANLIRDNCLSRKDLNEIIQLDDLLPAGVALIELSLRKEREASSDDWHPIDRDDAKAVLEKAFRHIESHPESRSFWLVRAFWAYSRGVDPDIIAIWKNLISKGGLIVGLWLLADVQNGDDGVSVGFNEGKLERFGDIDSMRMSLESNPDGGNRIINRFDEARVKALQTGQWIAVNTLKEVDNLN